MIGAAQQHGKTCALIDAEGTYDKAWGERLGVNNEQLLYNRSRGVAQAADTGVDLIKAGVDILVVDSISSILATANFEKDGQELKEFEKTGQIGSHAKDLTRMSNMFNAINEHTAIILISQHRNKITAMYTQLQPMGGEGIKFNSSTIIKLFSSESDAKAITGKIPTGDRLIDQKIGRPVNWEIEFNKLGPMGETGTYDFYFRGDKIGIDNYGEVVDLAIVFGIIEKAGAWLSYGDKRMQGRLSVVEWLSSDQNAYDEIVGKINAKFK